MDLTEVEWRRRWAPSIHSSPWKLMEQHDLHIKSVFTDDRYHVMLTDFKRVWSEELSSEEVEALSKALNPSIEAPVSRILDVLKNHLENADHYSLLDVNLESDAYFVQLQTKLAGIPFLWNFTCAEQKDGLASHVTYPLVAMAKELARRQEKLFDLLKKKDREIEERKNNNGNVSRGHFQTAVFDETAFNNQMLYSPEFEKIVTTSVSPFDSNLYTDIMMKREYVIEKHTPTKDCDKVSTFEATAPSVGGSWSLRIPTSLAANSTISPSKSPGVSPVKNPTPEKASSEDLELSRRRELEKRLREEEREKEKNKKKKKLKF